MNYVPMQIDTSPHEVWKSMRIRAPHSIQHQSDREGVNAQWFDFQKGLVCRKGL